MDRAIDSQGAVVGVIGSTGSGKSRLVREVSAMAATRHVDVFATFCESHTSQVPFHAVARLLRAITGIKGLDPHAARARIRAQFPDAEPEDLVLFDDLLGTANPEMELPKIDPDARRRGLTALVNAASLARERPGVYVIEDAHWIDEVSESMLAEFFTVIPQTPSLVLVTYRPEYQGTLSRVASAQTIALVPLNYSETAALVTGLLGSDPSLGGLITMITEKAAGNPFFAEEIVRDLAERGVLGGNRSAYESTADAAEVSVPATLQATIAARIDRLDPAAKRTLSAAAVIGSRFSRELLETLGIDPAVQDLLSGEFIDQITFTRQPEYVFHHPLIRTVGYESQLKSGSTPWAGACRSRSCPGTTPWARCATCGPRPTSHPTTTRGSSSRRRSSRRNSRCRVRNKTPTSPPKASGRSCNNDCSARGRPVRSKRSRSAARTSSSRTA